MGGITFSQGGQVKLCLSPLGTQLGARFREFESDDEVGWMRLIFVPLKKCFFPPKRGIFHSKNE